MLQVSYCWHFHSKLDCGAITQEQFLITTCSDGDLIKPHLKVGPSGPNPQAGMYQGWKLVYPLPEMPLNIGIHLVSSSPQLWFFSLFSESFMHFAAIKEKSSFSTRCQKKFLWKKKSYLGKPFKWKQKNLVSLLLLRFIKNKELLMWFCPSSCLYKTIYLLVFSPGSIQYFFITFPLHSSGGGGKLFHRLRWSRSFST